MSKTLDDLIRSKHLPAEIIRKMERTEPGMLSAALGAMVYDRSHDDKMHSVYPQRVYLGRADGYMAGKIGCDPTGSNTLEGRHIKSDVAIARVIALLDALALQYALENR